MSSPPKEENPQVYVGHLSWRAQEKDLEKEFDHFGEIKEIFVKKGFAFIKFMDSKAAEQAVKEMDGKEICGDRVVVEFAGTVPLPQDQAKRRTLDPAEIEVTDTEDHSPTTSATNVASWATGTSHSQTLGPTNAKKEAAGDAADPVPIPDPGPAPPVVTADLEAGRGAGIGGRTAGARAGAGAEEGTEAKRGGGAGLRRVRRPSRRLARNVLGPRAASPRAPNATREKPLPGTTSKAERRHKPLSRIYPYDH